MTMPILFVNVHYRIRRRDEDISFECRVEQPEESLV